MTTTPSPQLPLAGLRVLDVASFIAAPVAATVMADYGADVIKVEPPGTGDPNRETHKLASYPKPRNGVNYPWEMDSRGKRSIALDLRTPEGQQVLYRLAARSDILITNYPLEVRERLKMSYAHMRPLSPRMIYASFTGYGERGPDAHLPGFDSTAYFARSGLLDCNRYEGQAPGVAMPAQGDRASGMALLSGILLALIQRDRTGEGTEVTSNLYANALWSNGVGAQAALLGAFLPPRPPRERPRNALTNIYRTRDDRWIVLTIVREEKCWGPFCAAIGKPELENEARFATLESRRMNSAALTAICDPIFAAHDWAYWREKLFQHSLPVGLIGQLQDLPSDAQAAACGAVVETANPAMPRGLAAPFALASAPAKQQTRAPGLGEQTEAILHEAGFSAAEVAALKVARALG